MIHWIGLVNIYLDQNVSFVYSYNIGIFHAWTDA